VCAFIGPPGWWSLVKTGLVLDLVDEADSDDACNSELKGEREERDACSLFGGGWHKIQ
jgi:hypothetical protein